MRLIDADELKEHAGRDRLDSRELIFRMIDNAPTVKTTFYTEEDYTREDGSRYKDLYKDVLTLLKGQEAIIKAQQFVLNNACEKLKEQKIAMKPKNIDKVGLNCPVCGLRMARSHKYCYQCGQEIDLE